MYYSIWHTPYFILGGDMEPYKSKDILEKLGISKIQLSHWINKGAIIPHREDFRRGGSHEFNKQNLIEAAICKELSVLKIPVKSIVEALKMMREVHANLLKDSNKLKEYTLFYSSPIRMDYGKALNIPTYKEFLKRFDSSDYEKVFMPGLIENKRLFELFEKIQVGVILKMTRILQMVN
jgi:DNA-binding transcriptional MerR regulator